MKTYLSIEEIMDFDDEKLEKYVLEKTKYLNSKSKEKVFLATGEKVSYHNGFLGDNVLICPFLDFTCGYSMRDIDYVKIFKELKNRYDVCCEDDFFMMVVQVLNNYLGEDSLGENDNNKKLNLILTYVSKGKDMNNKYSYQDMCNSFKRVSLNKLCHEEVCECVERSALFQNILSILGYETTMVLGSLVEISNQEIYHAFNVIRLGDDYCYLDVSLCNCMGLDNYYLEYCNKRIISEEEAYDLISGKGVVSFKLDGYSDKKIVNIIGNVKEKEKVLEKVLVISKKDDIEK